MFTSNPFAALTEVLPASVMQVYVVLMVLAPAHAEKTPGHGGHRLTQRGLAAHCVFQICAWLLAHSPASAPGRAPGAWPNLTPPLPATSKKV